MRTFASGPSSDFLQGVPQAVLFDVDGVLIDSLDIKGQAFAQTFGEFPEKQEEIIALHLANGGVNRLEKIKQIYLNLFGVEPETREIERRAEFFESVVRDSVTMAPEIEGAYQSLSDMSVRYPLHAVSATPSRELAHILTHRGLSEFFTSIHGWPPNKTVTVKLLVKDYGYVPDRCVLIGDSREDFVSAKSAGLRFIQVSKYAELDFAESSFVIRNLVNLSTIVESIMQ